MGRKMDVKERHSQALEKLLLEDRKPISHTSQQQNSNHIVNTASQTDRTPHKDLSNLAKSKVKRFNGKSNPDINSSNSLHSSFSTLLSSSSYISLDKMQQFNSTSMNSV